MDSLVRLLGSSLLLFALLLFAALVVAREVGFWLGLRRPDRGQGDAEGTGVLVGAMLGLLSFVLALTLAFANARFDERRVGTLTEANAIGTAWLRAKVVGDERMADLLQDYAGLRAAFIRASNQHEAIDSINARTAALQSEIWGNVAALAREQPNAVTASLIGAVNATFDASSAGRFAYEFRPAPQLFWLLIGITVVGMGVLGFQLGLNGRPLRLLSVMLAAMWTVVVTDIIDLGAARIGSIRADADVYDWTIASMRSGVPVPPPAGRESR